MTDISAPIQAMIDATNAGDTPAFLACFSEDAYLEDWGRGFTGQREIASWNETDNIGKRAHFDALAERVDGAVHVVTIRVSGGGYNGTGDIRFELASGLITRMIVAAG
jgi:hypothetical protein